MTTVPEKCQAMGCDRNAAFSIFDTLEPRPDVTGTFACEEHLGSLIGSVEPTEPNGPWGIFNANVDG